jgi:hypothetical protein
MGISASCGPSDSEIEEQQMIRKFEKFEKKIEETMALVIRVENCKGSYGKLISYCVSDFTSTPENNQGKTCILAFNTKEELDKCANEYIALFENMIKNDGAMTMDDPTFLKLFLRDGRQWESLFIHYNRCSFTHTEESAIVQRVRFLWWEVLFLSYKKHMLLKKARENRSSFASMAPPPLFKDPTPYQPTFIPLSMETQFVSDKEILAKMEEEKK